MIKPIQTLRALAVMLVVLFHLELATFERGFLGVDVFFTISGFVIYYTYINRINSYPEIVSFLKKRFFRLFPASFITAFFTIAVGLGFLLTQDIKTLLLDGLLSATSTINIYYLFTTNYFSIDMAYRPFLHYWSLALEEQYYVMFSTFLLLVVFFRNLNSTKKYGFSRYFIEIVLLLAFVTSLALSILIRDIHSPADFFNPVTRSWQFIAGMLAANLAIRFKNTDFGQHKLSLNLVQGLLITGITILVIVGLGHELIYDQIVLAIGVAAICFLAAQSIDNKLTNLPALQFIGKISYSLYLVHWPVVVYYRFLAGDNWSINEISMLLAVMFALACILHYTVELRWQTWPTGTRIPRFSATSVGFASVVLVGTVAASFHFQATDPKLRNDARKVAGVRAELPEFCNYSDPSHQHGVICNLKNNPGAPTLVIMGDSHVIPFIPSLAENKQYNFKAYIATGCLPFYKIKYENAEHQSLCDDFYNNAIDSLPEGQQVMLIGRWNGYSNLVENAETIEQAFKETLKKLSQHEVRILQQPFEYEELLPYTLAYAASPNTLDKITPNEGFFPNGIPLSRPVTKGQIKVVKTRAQICALNGRGGVGQCIYSPELGLFYADDNHLVPKIASMIKIVPKK